MLTVGSCASDCPRTAERPLIRVFPKCYFLLSGSPAVPIVYYVERLREGRSYTTRSVKAVQSGKVIFILMCSFHKPEPWQPSTQWAMPAGIPQPEECELEEVVYARRALKEGLDARLKSIFEEFSRERTTSPIAVKVAKEYAPDKEGKLSFMYWMRARDIPKYEPAFQKVCTYALPYTAQC